MISTVVVIFIVAYAAIALEHPLKINKSASALVGAGVLWTLYAALGGDHELIGNQLDESVTTTAKIVFFLIGAMTIVEVIDAHNGFEVITSLIRTRSQVTLMWIVCFVTFFLSAVLDNLGLALCPWQQLVPIVGISIRSVDRDIADFRAAARAAKTQTSK